MTGAVSKSLGHPRGLSVGDTHSHRGCDVTHQMCVIGIVIDVLKSGVCDPGPPRLGYTWVEAKLCGGMRSKNFSSRNPVKRETIGATA